MARVRRVAGLVLGALGVGLIAWAFTTWLWQDPFTRLYAEVAQRQLAARYEALLAARPSAVASRRGEARALRLGSRRGDPLGRLSIPRLGLDVLVVKGTDARSLRSGPGIDGRSYLPAEGRLVYIAGHRTTYGAPFSAIERLRPGDAITLEMPYGIFEYRVRGHRVVDDRDLSVLRAPPGELLRLQACHPRFFATKRYVVTAEPAGSLQEEPDGDNQV